VLIILLIWTIGTGLATSSTHPPNPHIIKLVITEEKLPESEIRFCVRKAIFAADIVETRFTVSLNYQLALLSKRSMTRAWDHISIVDMMVVQNIVVAAYELPLSTHPDTYGDTVYYRCLDRADIANSI